MNESNTQHLLLPDGRLLSYSDIGTGENGTWIHCHGIPGSRHELSQISEELCAKGLRVIVPDRPGYGDSTPCDKYNFNQHSADLRALRNYLHLDGFAVSGFSGGGVFALAAAYDLATFVERVSIAGTPAVPLMKVPFNHASELSANSWQAALENTDALAMRLEPLTCSVNALAEALVGAAGKPDRDYLFTELVHEGFKTNLGTALSQGSAIAAAAIARDSFLIAHPWPFRPESLTKPVRVIHGEKDGLVHLAHQAALTSKLLNSESHTASGGHFSVLSLVLA